MELAAALIAALALGANLTSGALLLILNPRNREVRWYVAFLGVIALWLVAQGALALAATHPAWPALHDAAIVLLPAVFLAFTTIGHDPSTRAPWPIVISALALVPALVPAAVGVDTPSRGLALTAWCTIAWLPGSWLLYRSTRKKSSRAAGAYAHRPSPGPTHQSRRGPGGDRAHVRPLTTPVLLASTPIVIVAGVLLGAKSFALYLLPPLTVVVQLLVFHGIARLRFYDIEVRATRSGELAAEVAATERLLHLGEISASVAHEVRNPLTGMRSLAQRLAEEEIEPDRRRRYASVILDEVDRLERMVGNLLGLARRRPLALGGGPTALEALFEELTLLVASRAARRGVTIDARAGRLVTSAPREALAQLLLNLLLNAITHSPSGGRVWLLAHQEDDAIVVTVRDEGPGIPRDQRERIFQPFTSTGPLTGADDHGVGLGLALARRLSDELGWRLVVEDAPGGGAELRVILTAKVEARG